MALETLTREEIGRNLGRRHSRWLGLPMPVKPVVHRSPAECHPDRPLRGRGLCHRCYMREWRVKRLEVRRG